MNKNCTVPKLPSSGTLQARKTRFPHKTFEKTWRTSKNDKILEKLHYAEKTLRCVLCAQQQYLRSFHQFHNSKNSQNATLETLKKLFFHRNIQKAKNEKFFFEKRGTEQKKPEGTSFGLPFNAELKNFERKRIEGLC